LSKYGFPSSDSQCGDERRPHWRREMPSRWRKCQFKRWGRDLIVPYLLFLSSARRRVGLHCIMRAHWVIRRLSLSYSRMERTSLLSVMYKTLPLASSLSNDQQDGKTPLDLARAKGRPACVKYLERQQQVRFLSFSHNYFLRNKPRTLPLLPRLSRPPNLPIFKHRSQRESSSIILHVIIGRSTLL
jgi:hypothetical protein